jgi:hypothetical protein
MLLESKLSWIGSFLIQRPHVSLIYRTLNIFSFHVGLDIGIITHGGTIGAIFRMIGHKNYFVPPGGTLDLDFSGMVC